MIHNQLEKPELAIFNNGIGCSEINYKRFPEYTNDRRLMSRIALCKVTVTMQIELRGIRNKDLSFSSQLLLKPCLGFTVCLA